MSALSSLSLLALATAATATLAPMAPSVLAGRHAERCGFMADMSHAPVADASTDQQARLDIVETAAEAGSFQTLLAAAEAAGLVDALKADGPITVFAPTDEAFAKLPGGTVDSLLEPENRELLAEILKYHVVPGRVYAVDAIKAGRAETLQGGELIIDLRNGRVSVDNATLSRTDIDASNGVIHVIDRVILPPGM